MCEKPRKAPRTRLGSSILFTRLFRAGATYPLVYLAVVPRKGLFRIAPASFDSGWQIDRHDGMVYTSFSRDVYRLRSEAAQALAKQLGV